MYTNPTRDDVRRDRNALQALKRLLEQMVSALASAPVGTDQEIIGGKMDYLLGLAAELDALNELGAAVDEDILVPDSGPSYDAWSNRDGVAVMLVVADGNVGVFGE